MSFNDELKLKVKKKAMFQCCRCHEIGIEVHHIISQKDKGPDTFENAAPLCPNCHTWFGDNPKKIKEITEMRDNWYEVIEKMYGPQSQTILPQVERINENFTSFRNKQSTDLEEMKKLLKDISNKAINSMTLGTASLTASNLVSASGATLAHISLTEIPNFVACPMCGELVNVNYQETCPKCGSSLLLK